MEQSVRIKSTGISTPRERAPEGTFEERLMRLEANLSSRRGPEGEKGPKGDQGPQGPQGERGPAGTYIPSPIEALDNKRCDILTVAKAKHLVAQSEQDAARKQQLTAEADALFARALAIQHELAKMEV